MKDNFSKFANEITSTLDGLVKEQSKAISQLPPEQRNALKEHQVKINNMMKLAKNGDYTQLQKILNNHANTNN